jgi:hypothetical protein
LHHLQFLGWRRADAGTLALPIVAHLHVDIRVGRSAYQGTICKSKFVTKTHVTETMGAAGGVAASSCCGCCCGCLQ